MSFRYTRNNNGPNMKPCGTPDLIFAYCDFAPCRITHYSLSLEQLLMKLSRTPLTPMSSSLYSKPLCHTLSKALDESRHTNLVTHIWHILINRLTDESFFQIKFFSCCVDVFIRNGAGSHFTPPLSFSLFINIHLMRLF